MAHVDFNIHIINTQLGLISMLYFEPNSRSKCSVCL